MSDFIVDAINELTKTEGSAVTFNSKDPEDSESCQTIDCIGDWTNWVDRRFIGGNWKLCLAYALREKEAWIRNSNE
jgi:hypothetical protein